MAKQVKQVQVIERNDKGNGTVLYTVRSSNGVDTYTTTLVNGKATACNCPSYKPCYHMTQLVELEAEYADATLPLLNTPEAKELIADLGKALAPKKVRRSSANVELVTSLQVAQGVKIRKVRGQKVLVAAAVVTKKEEIVTNTPVVPTQEAIVPTIGNAEMDAFVEQLEKEFGLSEVAPDMPPVCPVDAPVCQEVATSVPPCDKGTLGGNKGFSRLKIA